MVIRINGAAADIQLETEKTVGEILCGLDSWFAGTGHRLSGLGINGETINAVSMETCFGRSIDTIDDIDISTSSLPELLVESLLQVLRDIGAYEAVNFDDKAPFLDEWKESPQAQLLAEQSPDLYNWVVKTFSGEGSGTQALRSLVEERFRELQDPAGEMDKVQSLVAGVCTRLEELPLDVQTGKDTRAAETVNAFSGIAEKIFRIFNALKMEGFPVEHITVEDMPIAAYFAEFSTALRELLAAYEQHDTVLIGDLAEYEIAPRLRALHAAILGETRRVP
jgi:hypothetical protein